VGQNGPYYLYQGPGKGEYTPRRFLSPAVNQALTALTLQYKPAPGLSLSLETAGSRYRQNTFSSLSSSRYGGAVTISGRFERPETHLGLFQVKNLKLNAKYLKLNPSFHRFGSNEPIDYREKWTIDDRGDTLGVGSGMVGRREIGLSGKAELIPGMYIRGGISQRNYTAEDVRTLGEFGVDYSQADGLELTALHRELHKTGRESLSGYRNLNKISVRRSLKFVQPSLEYETGTARWKDGQRSGRGYQLLRLSVDLPEIRGLKTGVKLDARDNQKLVPSRIDTSKVYGGEVLIDYAKDNYFNTSIRLAHRRTGYLVPGKEQEQNNWADIHLFYRKPDGPFSCQLYYQAKNSMSAAWMEAYRKTGYGRGGYSYDPESDYYYPDPDGKYRKVKVWCPSNEPHVRVTASLGVDMRPAKLNLWPLNLQRNRDIFRISSKFEIVEENKEKNSRDIYLLRLKRFQNAETTFFGRLGFSHIIELFPENPRYRGRLTFREYRLTNNANSYRKLKSAVKTVNLTGQFRTSPRLTLEPSLSHRKKAESILGSEINNLSSRNQVKLSLKYSADVLTEICWSMAWARERLNNDYQSINVNMLSLSAGLNRLMGDAGRFSSKVEWVYKHKDTPGYVRRFVLGEYGLGNTLRWETGFERGLNEHLLATVSYHGSRKPGGYIIHYGRAEIKALF